MALYNTSHFQKMLQCIQKGKKKHSLKKQSNQQIKIHIGHKSWNLQLGELKRHN